MTSICTGTQYGRVLPGNTKLIFIELSKLEAVEKKPVSEMAKIEQWSLFLKHANNKKKRELIQSIIKNEEGICMGAKVLEPVQCLAFGGFSSGFFVMQGSGDDAYSKKIC